MNKQIFSYRNGLVSLVWLVTINWVLMLNNDKPWWQLLQLKEGVERVIFFLFKKKKEKKKGDIYSTHATYHA